ncbi:hypothetical protein QJS83_14875 [Bdellovibrio sp. 22V]|uniref:hypothetical protein n=1 Tax=Bdellovibrio sp. 22V TaxID=3044166 RepID=UPI00254366F6|nr:hypothetical protein [Bdellovibrio sp. 22V]WII71746.1 hypothetical protein QJS83_14875 [Bdellovibrio sp. 22V]
MNKVVWSLFDGSGLMVEEYAKYGYQCYCINADEGNHGEYFIKVKHPNIHYVNKWIDTDWYGEELPQPDIIFAFPDCTFLADSGVKHTRSQDDILMAVNLAKHVEIIANHYGVPWFVENPVGKLSKLWRKPNVYIDPYQYGGYLEDSDGSFHARMPLRDAYTKKTGIWCGNRFVIPERKPVPHIGCFWGWAYLGGKSPRTKQLRSLTPRGWARAVFQAN